MLSEAKHLYDGTRDPSLTLRVTSHQPEVTMTESNDKQEKFFGADVDRDMVLRLSRWADGTAWVILTIYVLTWLFSVLLSISQYFNGLYFAKGSESFLTTFSIFTPFLQQPLPGIFYFFGLQGISKGMLILLDMEDNTRRAARK